MGLTASWTSLPLTCPRCQRPATVAASEVRCASPECELSTSAFPMIDGQPALIDFGASVLDNPSSIMIVRGANARRRGPRYERLARLPIFRLHPYNRVAEEHCQDMADRLVRSTSGNRPTILIVGGGSVGNGMQSFYDRVDIDLVSFDIYRSPFTTFIADAHRIPLPDASVDGVVIQAVLEHVIEPSAVVDEIHRVLRDKALVFATCPFMQQVHEGAFDFTRFTHGGLRYLFRHFEELDSGATAGAGTALAWSIDYFVRSLTRSSKLGLATRQLFSWLSAMDRFLDARFSLDAASGTFFYGVRSSSTVTTNEIVTAYRGAQGSFRTA